MPFSNEHTQNSLSGNPPSFEEIFKLDKAREAQSVGGSSTENGSAPFTVSVPATAQNAGGQMADGSLPLVRAAESGVLAAEALRLSSINELPSIYSVEHAREFAKYVEEKPERFKGLLEKWTTKDGRQMVLKDVDRMFGNSLETKRRHILLRWFRDRVTPANLNPAKLIDPMGEKSGSIFQIVHPVVFNLGLFVFLFVVTLLTFAYFFRGGR